MHTYLASPQLHTEAPSKGHLYDAGAESALPSVASIQDSMWQLAFVQQGTHPYSCAVTNVLLVGVVSHTLL